VKIDMPVRFTGTDAEREANRRSHSWWRPDPDETPECDECCAKSWHAAADYPCGTQPPRQTVEV
jgi:hypothetical protein